MQALLLIAHGSRRQASNEEVKTLTEVLAKSPENDGKIVECAFLELADPSITLGFSACVQQGATCVVVVPYFLSAGRHVIVDIPAELSEAQNMYPQVEIKIAPYLGSANEIGDILISLSKQA